MMPTPVILLKEGTDTSQGVPQLVSNINACQVIAEAVRTTLGPRGMDKLIVDDRGKATISNDGATILKLLDVVHPAARTLVDIAKSQDAEVGDGTTSVTLLAAEFLKQIKPYIEEGLHPQIIIRAFRTATQLAVRKIQTIAVTIKKTDFEEFKGLLEKCAATALSSKLIAQHKDFFAKMVVDAVMLLDELLQIKMIGIKKVQGGALESSQPEVAGVSPQRRRKPSLNGFESFEMQTKKYKLTQDCPVERRIGTQAMAEKDNGRRLPGHCGRRVEHLVRQAREAAHLEARNWCFPSCPSAYIITQYFADKGHVVLALVECRGRSQENHDEPVEDPSRPKRQRLTPGRPGAFAHSLRRYNFFTGCPKAKTCTIILRGGAEQFMEETERSLHDAIMIVRRAIKNDSVVAGGGAIEMELSKYLRDYSRTIPGKQQLLIGAYAKALEIIPRQLCDNAGFDATNILNKLRAKHAQGGMWYGVDVSNEDIADNFEAFVWEPAVVRINALTAAAEAACLIVSVDETIKNPRSTVDGPPAGRGRGRGRPHNH
uniref:T-complex protein 1 subunit eta n=1 Tax=Sphaerodactylus townsendi TaxID=933632 RepID=A0ACB8E9B3_9SAUR